MRGSCVCDAAFCATSPACLSFFPSLFACCLFSWLLVCVPVFLRVFGFYIAPGGYNPTETTAQPIFLSFLLWGIPSWFSLFLSAPNSAPGGARANYEDVSDLSPGCTIIIIMTRMVTITIDGALHHQACLLAHLKCQCTKGRRRPDNNYGDDNDDHHDGEDYISKERGDDSELVL